MNHKSSQNTMCASLLSPMTYVLLVMGQQITTWCDPFYTLWLMSVDHMITKERHIGMENGWKNERKIVRGLVLLQIHLDWDPAEVGEEFCWYLLVLNHHQVHPSDLLLGHFDCFSLLQCHHSLHQGPPNLETAHLNADGMLGPCVMVTPQCS